MAVFHISKLNIMAVDGEEVLVEFQQPPSRPEILFSEWSGRYPRVNSRYEEPPKACPVCGDEKGSCTEGGGHFG